MTVHRASHAPGKVNLFGLDQAELMACFEPLELPSYRARQVFRWMYAARNTEVERWSDLPIALRRKLIATYDVDPGRLTDRVEASDGTVKYRVTLARGGEVEAVHMVQAGRRTLCLSSQVGCALDCDFCLTGKMGFRRHLAPGEIVGQVALIAADHDFGSEPFNVVFMGMGEPLHNYDAVLAAVKLLADPDGFGLSRRRITVSTAGLAPAIERLAAEPVRPRLAVSLNATTNELRDRLMPINRKYPIERLLAACRQFADAARERITFEYVLLAGVNDAAEDLSRLAGIVRSAPAKLNLIPFNPVPGLLDYRPPSRQATLAFRDALLTRNVPASIRWSRGAEARAACGQLAILSNEGADT